MKKRYKVYFEWTMRGWDEFEADSEEDAILEAEDSNFHDLFDVEQIDDPMPVEAEEIL
jgi:hypothetical protein